MKEERLASGRVIGTEQEYNYSGVRGTFDSQCYWLPLFEYVPDELLVYKSAERLNLVNQGLLYLDQRRVEGSSPECRGPIAAALYDTAITRILAVTLKKARSSDELFQKLSLYKSNRVPGLQSEGERGATIAELGVDRDFKELYLSRYSCGSHANYLMRRRENLKDILPVLCTFRLARWALIGNGWLMLTPQGGVRFIFSQKGDIIRYAQSGSTTNIWKPLHNTKDEPHADPQKWRRLHDISGNANMSELQLILKLGTFNLVLSMAETPGFLRNFPVPRNISFVENEGSLIGISSAWNADIFGEVTIPTDRGGKSWLDYLKYFLEEAHRFFEEGRDELTPENQLVLNLWSDISDAFARRDIAFLSRYLDWAAIWEHLVQPRVEKFGFPAQALIGGANSSLPKINWKTTIGSAKRKNNLVFYLLQRIIEYANIETEASLYGRLCEQGLLKRHFSDAELSRAEVQTPLDTRAGFKSGLMIDKKRWANELPIVEYAWGRFSMMSPEGNRVLSLEMPDPRDGAYTPASSREEFIKKFKDPTNTAAEMT